MFANPHKDSILINMFMLFFYYKIAFFISSKQRIAPLFLCTYIRCDKDISQKQPYHQYLLSVSYTHLTLPTT